MYTLHNIKIRKVGNSLGLLLPRELAQELGVAAGDTLHLVPDGAGGFRLTPYDPDFAAALEAFEATRSRFRNALRELGR